MIGKRNARGFVRMNVAGVLTVLVIDLKVAMKASADGVEQSW